MADLSRIFQKKILAVLFSAIIPFHLNADEHGEKERSSKYFMRGMAQYKAEMYAYSLHSLDSALRIDPTLYEAANTIAEIYILKNDRFRAKEYLARSLAIKPNQPDTLCRLAEQHEYFHEDETAFKTFKKAVETDPLHVKGNAALVRHYLSRGDKNSAEKHFKASCDEGMKAMSHLLKLADEKASQKKYTEAVRLYHTVTAKAPATIEAYLALYKISRIRGDHTGAIKYLEQLKFIKPDYTRAYFLIGVIYFEKKMPGSRRNNIDISLRNLNKAVELDPDIFEAHYMLSDIYRITGDFDASEKHRLLGEEAESRVKNRNP